MKKLIIFTILIVAISFGIIEYKFKSGLNSNTAASQTQSTQNTSSQQQSQTSQDQTSSVQPNLVVSADDLAKLQAQNLVSSDTRYYIKQASPFPKIVDLQTGNEYFVRPSANYTKITKLSWSGDGQTLVYIYQVSDPQYSGMDLINTVSVSDVVNQKFTNGARVLVAAGKLDYIWYDAQKILIGQLNNFDPVKKFYGDGNILIYDVNANQFEYPLQNTAGLNNLYSITLNTSKFLYVQAKLDETGSTIGQQYVVANLDGSIVETTDTYDANWNK